MISVGIDNLSADCIAKNIVETPLKTDFDLCYNSEVIHISLPVSGKHNLYNAMMAFIAGRLGDIPTHKIVSGLQKYQQLGFRQHLFRSGAYTVYADCYNASARSIKSALAVLDTIDAPGEKVAVLGDIAEIEGFEQETYRNVAASVDESTASVLVTFGPESGRINTNLKRPIPSFHANNRSELNLILKKLKKDGARIFLFKGSRTMALEQSIQAVFPFLYLQCMAPVGIKYIKWTLRTL